MLNRVMLIGNIGQDVELRRMTNGDGVVNISLATSRKWKDKQGQKQEKTDWHSLVMFGKLAEIAKEYYSKGDQIYAEGRIETRSWEQNGEKKYKTEVIVDRCHKIGGRGDSSSPAKSNNASSPQTASYDSYNDDIPF